MNKSKELINKLKQAETEELLKYKQAVSKIVSPLANQVFFTSKLSYESFDEQSKFNFLIKIIDPDISQNPNDYFFLHTIQVMFSSSKTDKQENITKIIRAKDVKVQYFSAEVEHSDILELIGDNSYYNSNTSQFSDVSQIASKIFEFYPQEVKNNTDSNWTYIGKKSYQFSMKKSVSDVFIHNSLITNQIVPQIVSQIEKFRQDNNQYYRFICLENKLHKDFLDFSLPTTNNSSRKNKI